MFWLADKEMYTCMNIENTSPIIERAMDYHKEIRFVTSTLAGEGYLNFMGNEFGHPEWIDFPREGNGNSGKYARRQWSLVDNPNLKYRYLNRFDNAMIKMLLKYPIFSEKSELVSVHNDNKTLVFKRGGLLFLFNFHGWITHSMPLPDKDAKYRVILNSASPVFGGKRSIPSRVSGAESFPLYPRSAVALEIIK